MQPTHPAASPLPTSRRNARSSLTRHARSLLSGRPGVGPILGAAVIDFERFDNARQMCAFIGTCPSRQSGSSAASTRINKQGHALLRRLASMGALSAMRYNPHIKQCAVR